MSTDQTAVWAYGKAEPGWYCAKWTWDTKYAAHLEEVEYRVSRSIGKPLQDGTPTMLDGKTPLTSLQ
jgi:hypothetical protein